jgi:hypothetical protein
MYGGQVLLTQPITRADTRFMEYVIYLTHQFQKGDK